ncbi:hypothetical protein MLD38_033142 [Melastoma candidum]|uniref:Uncharacterized protein n=1 Tax=Melastoma candidum TaxID=119954 RepID=A0ACB9M5U1_9MYRT|nr:hypothetical protein MLD38_033142 [Melastoma candidum]
MEARQFKAFAEEKMGHDKQALAALADLLFKKEEAIQSLTCEVQAYRHRMMSYGISESGVDGDSVISMRDLVSGRMTKKYVHGETPISRDRLNDLEFQIQQMEQSYYNNQSVAAENIPEKIIVGQSPRKSGHRREYSGDSLGTRLMLGQERALDMPFDSPRHGCGFDASVPDNINYQKHNTTPDADDDASDTRTCIIDSVQPGNDIIYRTACSKLQAILITSLTWLNGNVTGMRILILRSSICSCKHWKLTVNP